MFATVADEGSPFLSPGLSISTRLSSTNIIAILEVMYSAIIIIPRALNGSFPPASSMNPPKPYYYFITLSHEQHFLWDESSSPGVGVSA